ncbi:MAG: GYD domain-containing protein [Thermoplasmata archaeon]|nr:GYD domain-containing protein [Thermoplasmata archaeon]
MPLYMFQFAYSPESWAALVKKPEDRSAAVDALAKSVGGRLVSLFYHMGDYDGTAIIEAPDDMAANAAIMASVASGGIRSSRTTRLYSPKELVDILGRAGKAPYRPPGKS